MICLLALYPIAGLTAAATKSPTYDEPAHLAAGYSIHAGGDHRVADPTHLPQWWFALPLRFMNVRFVDDVHSAWRRPHVELLGSELLYALGNDADAMIFAGRAMNALLAMVLGTLVWWWSRRIFGPMGGLVSLTLYALSPTILAHGCLITADLAAALGFILSTGLLWRVIKRFTWPRAIASSLAVAALLLTKPSCVLIVPIAIVLALLQRPKFKPLAWIVVTHIAIGFVAIWGFYQFRYSAFADADPAVEGFRESWEQVLADDTLPGRVIGFARDRRLLPESYLYGYARFTRTWQGRKAFMNGRWTESSWPTFFPYALLVKTTLGAIVITIVALYVLGRQKRLLRRTTPIWVLLAVYWLVAVTTDVNIGHRHVLLTYPAMFILCGAATRWRYAKVVVGVALLAVAVESVAIWPHYLAYFNVFTGGPRNAYRHLVDSSLDWGQDLPALKTYLDKHAKGQRVYLSYFGTADPTTYGIDFTPLPSFILYQRPAREPAPYGPGIYCVSATMLQTTYLKYTGRWCREYEQAYRQAQSAEQFEQLRFARLAAMLRQREPDAQVGYSILIYNLSPQDVMTAQVGQWAQWPNTPGVEP